MDENSIQGQLAELRKLTEENNRILKAMRRDALVGGIIKTLLWVVLIAGSYYFTIKALGPFMGMLEGSQKGQGQDFKAILDQYKSLMGE